MMTGIKQVALMGLFLLSGNAVAKDYQFEFSAATSADSLGYGLEYYFDPVDGSKGPYTETAFLNRASSVYLKRSEESRSYSAADLIPVNEDSTLDELGLVLMSEGAPYYLSFKKKAYSEDLWIAGVIPVSGDKTDSISLGLGMFTDENSLLGFDLEKVSYVDYDFWLSIDQYIYSIFYKSVNQELAGNHSVFAARVKYLEDNHGNNYTIANLQYSKLINKNAGLRMQYQDDVYSYRASEYSSQEVIRELNILSIGVYYVLNQDILISLDMFKTQYAFTSSGSESNLYLGTSIRF